jgi:hypothetical protein
MASRQPVRIHEQVFPTKDAARKYIREIFTQYADHEPLSDAYKEFVIDMVKRNHRLAAQKLRGGVSKIIIKTVLPFGTRAFYIVRDDGADVEVSWVECLNPTSQKTRFQYACREAIHDQIEQFVRTSFEFAEMVPCAITGGPVTRNSCEVDHEPPFLGLVERFLQETGIDIEKVAIGGDVDHETRDYFEDAELRRRFADFHASNARLRITTPHANRGRRRKAR